MRIVSPQTRSAGDPLLPRRLVAGESVVVIPLRAYAPTLRANRRAAFRLVEVGCCQDQIPPVQTLPVQEPPVHEPPVQLPPVQEPPVQEPPVQLPPVQLPPVHE